MLSLEILSTFIVGFCFGSATSPALGSIANVTAAAGGASFAFSSSFSSTIFDSY
jgi:hypothetical protein